MKEYEIDIRVEIDREYIISAESGQEAMEEAQRQAEIELPQGWIDICGVREINDD